MTHTSRAINETKTQPTMIALSWLNGPFNRIRKTTKNSCWPLLFIILVNFFTAPFFLQCQFLLYPRTDVPLFFFRFSLKIGFHCSAVFCSCFQKSLANVHLLIYTNCMPGFYSTETLLSEVSRQDCGGENTHTFWHRFSPSWSECFRRVFQIVAKKKPQADCHLAAALFHNNENENKWIEFIWNDFEKWKTFVMESLVNCWMFSCNLNSICEWGEGNKTIHCDKCTNFNLIASVVMNIIFHFPLECIIFHLTLVIQTDDIFEIRDECFVDQIYKHCSVAGWKHCCWFESAIVRQTANNLFSGLIFSCCCRYVSLLYTV